MKKIKRPKLYGNKILGKKKEQDGIIKILKI